MSFLGILFWSTVGVAISVVLPIIRQRYPMTQVTRQLWVESVVMPYIYLGVGSVVTALLLVAGMANAGTPITTWHQALLLGYFADATLQKFKP